MLGVSIAPNSAAVTRVIVAMCWPWPMLLHASLHANGVRRGLLRHRRMPIARSGQDMDFRSFVVGGVALGVGVLHAGCWVDSRFERVPESVCASREIWTYADKDSPLMNPGRSCVQCHAETNDPGHAPFYTFGGTVMDTPSEEDDCRGAGGMTVIVTDANGTEWRMVGNSAGN